MYGTAQNRAVRAIVSIDSRFCSRHESRCAERRGVKGAMAVMKWSCVGGNGLEMVHVCICVYGLFAYCKRPRWTGGFSRIAPCKITRAVRARARARFRGCLPACGSRTPCVVGAADDPKGVPNRTRQWNALAKGDASHVRASHKHRPMSCAALVHANAHATRIPTNDNNSVFA